MLFNIATLWNFNAAMHEIGRRIDGGYPTYFVTSDGCALSFDTAEKEGALIRDAIIANDRHSGWHVCAMTVNWEDPALYCEHSGLRIQSAYAEDEANEQAALTPSELDVFHRAYMECALWSSMDTTDDGDEIQFEDYELSVDAHNGMLNDCRQWTDANAADIRDACKHDGYSIERAGHDFWLTRCGHGAGFWDRGLEGVGERLSEAARLEGNIDLYLGDDGFIHAS